MKRIQILFIICILFLFQGCFAGKLSAGIMADRSLDNPMIVDFVFVFDPATLASLQKITAMQWYTKREQFKLDYELNNKIQILSYELVPGQSLIFDKFRPKLRTEGLLIYVSYLTPGDHRILLKDYERLELFLKRDDFNVKIISN